MKRSAGILLPIFSLPSAYGVGCLDGAAYWFVDWLRAAGQSYWQILPLGPTGYGDSPYQSFSAFAGNPYFISLEAFIREGLLTREECDAAGLDKAADEVDYERLSKCRMPLLELAYRRSSAAQDPEFHRFCHEQKWLGDYALFMALKEYFGGTVWSSWPEDIRNRRPQAVAHYRELLAKKVEYWSFVQYHFYRQWDQLREYAAANGVRIIGDIPIYAAYDSADVWADPQLFQLDGSGLPRAVAGCPPDGFAAQGQLWGNPLYDWPQHEKTGYAWWIARLSHCFRLYDVVRIDHFRGFDEYYAIPAGEKTAVNGRWEKGPGLSLFRAAERALGRREIIAEDLGFVTDSVRQLVKNCGFPNMKVLQFAFDTRDTGSRSDHLPHRYTEHCVAYTGTHDNQTLRAWVETIPEEDRTAARDYLCDFYTPDTALHKPLIGLLLRSRAALCVIPLQDWLWLDDRSRMNTPSTVGSNWKWRVPRSALTASRSEELRHMTEQYGRIQSNRKEDQV